MRQGPVRPAAVGRPAPGRQRCWAQCNCPEIDSVAVGFYQADPDCVDAWFKHYRDRIPRARTDKQRRRYLRHAFLLKPDYPGILEQYLGVADKSDLRLLRDVLRCMLKNHELFDAGIVTYNLALAHAQYLLGDYGNAYQGLFSGITRDVFCRIPHAERKALICNNLGVLQLLYQGTNNMYREPVKPVSAHDIGTSIGMLDSAPAPGARRDTAMRRQPRRHARPRSPCPSTATLVREEGLASSGRTAPALPAEAGFAAHGEVLHHLPVQQPLRRAVRAAGPVRRARVPARRERQHGHRHRHHPRAAAHRLQQPAAAVPHLRPGAQGTWALISVGRFCGTLPRHVSPVPDYDTTVFRSEMACCDVFGETPLRERLEHIDTLFQRPSARKLAFLLTDGMDNCTSPFDLCEIAQQLFDKGIHLSILHLLPDAEEYDEIARHLPLHGRRQPQHGVPPFRGRRHRARAAALRAHALPADAAHPAMCRPRCGWQGRLPLPPGHREGASPRTTRAGNGQHLGPGRQRPVTEVDCRIPRIPQQCKWGQRLPKD